MIVKKHNPYYTNAEKTIADNTKNAMDAREEQERSVAAA